MLFAAQVPYLLVLGQDDDDQLSTRHIAPRNKIDDGDDDANRCEKRQLQRWGRRVGLPLRQG